MRHEKSCGALVWRRSPADGQRYILMIRHKAGGHRSFPKGHMEKGETEVMTAMREVEEETAVRIHLSPDGGFRRTVHYSPMPGVKKEVVYFLTETAQTEICPREGEIAEVEWVPLGAAESALTHENDKRVLRAALRELRTKRHTAAYSLAEHICEKGEIADENDRLAGTEDTRPAPPKTVFGKKPTKRKETGNDKPRMSGKPPRKKG